VIIARRFRGPPQSGNGGYSCGMTARELAGPCEVTLRAPPPLDRELSVARRGPGVVVRDGEAVIAEAAPAEVAIEVPAPVTLAQAEEASKRYPWFDTHPFPECFVCGHKRAQGDGLRILPGAVEGRQVAAAPFTIDASICGADGLLRPEVVWAALDCPSWYGMLCFHPWEGQALLGRLAVRIIARPRASDRCVCMGWFLGQEGRKIHAGSAIHSASGELFAFAKATWIRLKPEAPADH